MKLNVFIGFHYIDIGLFLLAWKGILRDPLLAGFFFPEYSSPPLIAPRWFTSSGCGQ